MKMHAVYIDVVFLFLVIFLVLVKLSHFEENENFIEKVLPSINLAQAEESNSPGMTDEDILTLTINQEGDNNVKLFVGEEEFRMANLLAILQARNPGELALRVDEEVKHGLVMSVMLKCRDSGVGKVSFAYKGIK